MPRAPPRCRRAIRARATEERSPWRRPRAETQVAARALPDFYLGVFEAAWRRQWSIRGSLQRIATTSCDVPRSDYVPLLTRHARPCAGHPRFVDLERTKIDEGGAKPGPRQLSYA